MAIRNRTEALAAIKSAAACGDMKTALRIYCERRISRAAFDEAVAAGRSLAAFVAARDSARNAVVVSGV
jgi:hypothetical protein